MNWSKCGWRDEKYNKIRDKYIDRLYAHKETMLESEMMNLISEQTRQIDRLIADLTTSLQEVDKLRQENVFLLSLVQEDEQGIGDSMVSIGGQ